MCLVDVDGADAADRRSETAVRTWSAMTAHGAVAWVSTVGFVAQQADGASSSGNSRSNTGDLPEDGTTRFKAMPVSTFSAPKARRRPAAGL